MRHVQITSEEGFVDGGCHLLQRLEVEPDAPQHEIDRRFETEGRVGKDHERVGEALDEIRKLLLRLRLPLGIFSAKSAVDLEKHEIDELPLKSFLVGRRRFRLRFDRGAHAERLYVTNKSAILTRTRIDWASKQVME